PAAFGPVLAVGAAELARPYPKPNEAAAPHKTGRSAYSAWGAPLDLLAPGGQLGTDWNRDGHPDAVLAVGDAALAGPRWIAGTSASTAQAAGAAARLLAAGADPEEVRALLLLGATRLSDPAFQATEGAGVLD